MNWKQRLERAEKKGRFDETDLKLSQNWVTCAVGEKLNLKNKKEIPFVPMKFIDLGMDFVTHIKDNDIEKAKQTFEKIERYTN